MAGPSSPQGDPSPAVPPAPCPLCAAAGRTYLADAGRTYLRCERCALIYLHPAHRPTPLAEVLRYQEHENDAADAGYLAFLRRLAEPVAARLAPGARGLDFGCGPVPALGALLTAAGHPTASYDPLFRPHEALLAERYDFVTCCEVVEHLHAPDAVLTRLAGLLRPGGLLGVMTRFPGHDAPFDRWWYRRDPTHVCFFGEETMRWIADERGWALEIPRPHVALFRVP